jgi:hypothetical protein
VMVDCVLTGPETSGGSTRRGVHQEGPFKIRERNFCSFPRSGLERVISKIGLAGAREQFLRKTQESVDKMKLGPTAGIPTQLKIHASITCQIVEMKDRQQRSCQHFHGFHRNRRHHDRPTRVSVAVRGKGFSYVKEGKGPQGRLVELKRQVSATAPEALRGRAPGADGARKTRSARKREDFRQDEWFERGC